MKKPMVTRAMGVAAVLGVATSALAVNLALTPGAGDSTMPAELTFGPTDIVNILVSGPVNQGGGIALGAFTVQLETVVTKWDGNKLAFWYKVANVPRRDANGGLAASNDLNFMTVGLPSWQKPVEVNQTELQQGLSWNLSDQANFLGPVGFSYSQDPIEVGGTSSWAVLYTDATSYGSGTITVRGGPSQELFGLVPVPEPGTYAAMFALGLAGFAAYRRIRA